MKKKSRNQMEMKQEGTGASYLMSISTLKEFPLS